MITIQRSVRAIRVSINRQSTTSDPIDVASLAFGSIAIPAALDGDITIEVSNTPNDAASWTPLADKNKAPKATYAAGEGAQILHDETFHFRHARLVSSANESAKREFHLVLKG